ncbi:MULTISPECIES: GMC family oxidoreductase [unclassified Rhizobium]|uniref:FAD-dependent oxidoreductase n=2 Tax=Rhizobium TaxID=379 RepID=UPI000CF28A22|nr:MULTISPECIES: GMC family oxidoreductase [Rhizobium]MDK4741841.1 GMC family oxidoreductase [Rhizobium sp. CNPSo 3464]UWU20422.1 GMC family oxidoreductase [Rhizobium tropici]
MSGSMAEPDIVIIGSGIGGSTVASGLAASGANILILETGERLEDRPETRDQRAIFLRGHFRPKETWYEKDGKGFNPGNYYNVGGNSKFYGAVLIRYRREDFEEMRHLDGVSPAWPFPYEELEPWYSEAEQLYQVRGSLGDDPWEPPHSQPYPFPPVPDEPAIASVRKRLKDSGMHPHSLPLGVDIDKWLVKGRTPWDAHPHSADGKMDAETVALAKALQYPNVKLKTGARVTRLQAAGDGRMIAAVHYSAYGEAHVVRPKLVILAAGAVQSAVLLLRSADDANPRGLANRSDQVGRNFMNHNSSAVLAISPWYRNDSVYQKTFGFNDFYLSDGEGGPPLGNVQLLGRVSGTILKANMPTVPEWLLNRLSAHAIDFYAMSEDLPSPESRITVDGDRIVLQWVRTNWQAHLDLVKKLKSVLRKAGFPIVLSRPFDKRTPSHQCGTVKIGNDGSSAPLDVFCRAFDHPNLFVVDASFLPTSAAVNPALTVAAQALRVADHIVREELRS